MQRLRRRRPRLGCFVAALLLVLIAARFAWQLFGEKDERWAESIRAGECEIVRVVDGDTIIIRQAALGGGGTQRARVRLLGIDTPETVQPDHPVEPWGPEATEFSEEFLAGGTARVELDKRRIDRYERHLAWVYVKGAMLNEELVRAGLARVSTYPGDSASKERVLLRAEEEAREARRGIWIEASE